MKRETAAAGAFLAICLLGAFFMFAVAVCHNINGLSLALEEFNRQLG